MVARKSDVKSKIKGRSAIEVLTPGATMSAVPTRSKGGRAKFLMSPRGSVPASPTLSQSQANDRLSTRNRSLDSAPSSHPVDLSNADAQAQLVDFDATLSGETDPPAVDIPQAAVRPAPLKRRRGQDSRDLLLNPAEASPLSGSVGHGQRDNQVHPANASTFSGTADPFGSVSLQSLVRGSTPSETEGQPHGDIHVFNADGLPFPADADPPQNDTPSRRVSVGPSLDAESASGHVLSITLLPAPSSTILPLRELSRQRNDLMRAWQRLNNQIKAIERRGQLPHVLQPLPASPSIADSAAPALVHCVETTWAARKAVEKQLEKLAKSLPVYETFTKPTKGLGAGGLALIIGETGDLSQYRNPAKVWKRMGLAVFNGERQRRVAGNAEEAIRQGYSSHRRQIMWNIGDSMIKVGDTYRQVYLDRKAYELAKNPDAKPIVNHRRAQRYMEKRILRDLWRAWRDLHGVTP